MNIFKAKLFVLRKVNMFFRAFAAFMNCRLKDSIECIVGNGEPAAVLLYTFRNGSIARNECVEICNKFLKICFVKCRRDGIV